MNLVGMNFAMGLEGARLAFVAAGIPPALVDTGLPGRLALAWLDGLSLRRGRLLLGYVQAESDRPVVPEALTWFRAEAVEVNTNTSIVIQTPQAGAVRQ